MISIRISSKYGHGQSCEHRHGHGHWNYWQNARKLKSKKVKGEVLDLQNGAAFLSGVKIRGGTGLFFSLKNPSPGTNDSWSG